MTDLIYLDPYAVAELEPQEGSESDQQFISPFSVPIELNVSKTSGGDVASIAFHYPGGELGDEVQRMDDRNDPRVELRVGLRTGKLLSLTMEPPTDADGLQRIAERLVRQAKRQPTQAGAFSYIMIARVLERWAARIARIVRPG